MPVKKSTSVKKIDAPLPSSPPPKRLFRAEKDRVIAGVASGLAEYFNLDPILVRLAFVAFTFLNGFGFFTYLLLWIMLPRESVSGGVTDQLMRDNVGEIKASAEKVAAEIKTFSDRSSPRAHNWLGWGLVIFGILLLLRNFGILAPGIWAPALIIGLGLVMLVR